VAGGADLAVLERQSSAVCSIALTLYLRYYCALEATVDTEDIGPAQANLWKHEVMINEQHPDAESRSCDW
jgi:hypothetical protein